MVGTAHHYFARGNTACGAHSLYDSAFQGVGKIYSLIGYPGTGKSLVIQRLANEMMRSGKHVDLFHSPLNPDELDAMIITDLSVAVADERACQGLESLSGSEIIRIDLGQAVDTALLSEESRAEIQSLHNRLLESYSRAYDSFAAALRIHDEWESIYIARMDFQKADQIAQELATCLLDNSMEDKKATSRHLFFGAATPKGAVDHIQTITADLKTRIFVKGRPGSGKSTMLKRLAVAAAGKGFDVDVFHCGFDPNSLDMLVFRELSLAIFDSTAPHEYFPSRGGDEILDMYELAMQPGTDEQYASEIESIKQRYSQKMREATAFLRDAQEMDARHKAHYTAITDFACVDRLGSQLQSEIEELALNPRSIK